MPGSRCEPPPNVVELCRMGRADAFGSLRKGVVQPASWCQARGTVEWQYGGRPHDVDFARMPLQYLQYATRAVDPLLLRVRICECGTQDDNVRVPGRDVFKSSLPPF